MKIINIIIHMIFDRVGMALTVELVLLDIRVKLVLEERLEYSELPEVLVTMVRIVNI